MEDEENKLSTHAATVINASVERSVNDMLSKSSLIERNLKRQL